MYPLSREEREEIHEFISEKLRKEYIRSFCREENSKKWMVQDYQYLNKWTVKNNYPLSLISDIVENIGMKKVFTKMDLRDRDIIMYG